MDSDTESESSSAPSASPTASPLASYRGPPNLERIINHFVSAKRSLSSTSYILRANELITNSRNVLQEIAVLNARNEFGRRGVDEQIDTLYNIRGHIRSAALAADAEFQETIAVLDHANDRLQKTLNTLRETIVDASLHGSTQPKEDDGQSQTSSDVSQTDESVEKTLYDFIDESKHTEIEASLRSQIDTFNDSRSDLDNNVNNFSDSLKTLVEMLAEHNPDSDPVLKPTLYDEPPPTNTQLFHSMEDHAAEMATLLQSLVSHYDLCVSALRHTEGGGEAARQAVQSEELTKRASEVEESWYRKTVAEPMSEQERGELLRILENDSLEVEDVTIEIRDRNGEQESLWDELSLNAKKARSTHKTLRQVVDLLHEMRDIHLPSHINALSTFQGTWARIHGSVSSLTDELTGYSDFYSTFLESYDRLLHEVQRRSKADSQMRKVAEKAKREIEKLYESDVEARKDFMDEVGRFLPTDLWSGLDQEATRWLVEPVVDREVDHNAGT